ncbi:MAG TPA: hypothetical protein VFA12_04490 [Stellaceae bacterium]|nr:hypothetical protein [Stellaceae bacterium]
MFALPKLLILLLVAVAAWYALRRLNAPPRNLPRRRAAAAGPAQRSIPAEDLVLCDVCSAYVAGSAHSCGRPDCPRPR